jgi:hypothetical protein
VLTTDPTTRLALGQMRRSVRRLAAAGVAIVISTAFVAATLQAGTIITRTTYDQVAAQYASADLVVFDRDGTMTAADTEAVRAVEGVAAADGFRGAYAELSHGGRTVYQSLVANPSDQRLSPLVLADGAWADDPDHVVLPVDTAKLLGVAVGDTIASTRCLRGGHPAADKDGAECYGGQEVAEQLTVSGLVDDPLGTYAAGGGVGVVTAEALEQRIADEAGTAEPPGMRTLVVALDRPGNRPLDRPPPRSPRPRSARRTSSRRSPAARTSSTSCSPSPSPPSPWWSPDWSSRTRSRSSSRSGRATSRSCAAWARAPDRSTAASCSRPRSSARSPRPPASSPDPCSCGWGSWSRRASTSASRCRRPSPRACPPSWCPSRSVCW